MRLPLIALVVSLISLGLSGFVVFESRSELGQLRETFERELGLTKSAVDETNSLLLALSEESDVLEALQKKQEEAITGISENVSKQSTQLAAADISKAVTRWSPYVYRLECTFTDNDNGNIVTVKGSGVFEQTAIGLRLVTSKHAVERKGETLDDCTLSHPESANKYIFDLDDLTLEKDRDLAYGKIPKATVGFLSSKRCSLKPNIGDQILTLGYPSIGSDESITATEGIISGLEEEFFLSSAKIDRGNSGGAAIDLGRDCFLGVPTLTIAGRAESLARILPL